MCVPGNVLPQLCDENVNATFLAMLENTVERLHLVAFPIKRAAIGLVHPHVDFHPAEIQAQPAGVAKQVAPCLAVGEGRITAERASPSRPIVAAGTEKVLVRIDRWTEGVPRGSHPAGHGVHRVGHVDADGHRFGRRGVDAVA